MKENVLFLYYKTGGGHISAARALSECMKERFPETVEPFLLDGLPYDRKFERFLLEDMYRITVNYFQPAYKLVYDIMKNTPFLNLGNRIAVDMTRDHIADFIKKNAITRIIVLHFLLIEPAFEACRLANIQLPILTVVLDPFTIHPFWYAKKDIPTIVFSEKARETLLSSGWNPAFIRVEPIILNKKFETHLAPSECEKLKRRFGLDPSKKTILVAGGGEGLPLGDIILRILVKRVNLNVIIVCGKSRALLRESLIIKKRYPEKNLKVFGFTRQMYELINIADLVIAKAGPATLMEILMMGKPIIISSYIRGQEQGNIDFLLEFGLGWYIQEPHLICKKVREIIDNPEIHAGMKKAIKAMNLHSGTESIARQALDFEKTWT